MDNENKTSIEIRKEIIDDYNSNNNNFLNEFKNQIINSGHTFSRFQGLQFSKTSKFILVYSSKGGSSFSQNIMSKNNLEEDYFSWSLDMKPNRGPDDFTIYKGEIPDWLYDVLNGVSTHELIFLQRNPLQKYMSGTYQDIIGEVRNDGLLSSFLKDKYPKFNQSLYLDTVGKTLNTKTSIDDMPDWVKEVSTDLTLKYISGNFSCYGKVHRAHSLLTNNIIYDFLTFFDKIDKNKIKIFDIDLVENDIFQLFKMYYPELKEITNSHLYLFWTHRYRWELFFRDVLIKINGGKVESIALQDNLRDDYYYYFKIKKTFKKQILNLNKKT